MIPHGSVAGAMKAVALAVAILVGVKMFSMLMLFMGLYDVERGWLF